jgi:hypothetical protein
VPSSQALPPVDRDADALIADLFQKYPEARYRITQLAYVQEQALNAAQQRIQALQAQLQQAHQQQQAQGASPWGGAAPSGGQPPQHRGILGSLFGGGSSQPSAPPPQYQPPPPQYAPQYAPPAAMMQPQGTGFLGGALRTAVGVAGGVVAADALMNLFEGNRGGFGGGLGGGFGGGGFEAPAGFEPSAAEGPWSAGQTGFTPDPYDQGGLPKDPAGSDPVADNSGWAPAPDQGAWQPAADTSGGGWQDAPSDQAGGWQDASSDTGWDSGSNTDDGGWTDSSNDA